MVLGEVTSLAERVKLECPQTSLRLAFVGYRQAA